MIITKKAIPRRTVLRGLGATLALPVLDGMVPALSALAKTAAKPVVRFCSVYVPNGIVMEQWTPAAEGSAFEFTPILKPLEPFRKQLLVLSGLDNTGAISRTGSSGAHAQPAGAFLTGAEAYRTDGSSGVQLGISMDQVVAKALGQQTTLPSLELGLEGSDTANGSGTCDVGFNCAYQNNMSWSSSTTPMPPETNPRVVFERLFGGLESTDPAVRTARLRRQGSILDSVLDEVDRLQRSVGHHDRVKLNEYLESVREIERRIQNAEALGSRELPVVESPAGIPVSYEEHAKLMFDLQALAFQTDMTRIITFMIGREQSGTTYPQIGVPDTHHPISHHGNDKKKLESLTKINTYHVTLFAHFLDKLRSTSDGEGTLLDHAMILYGGGISDGNRHDIRNVPILLAGGGAGHLKSGRHIKFATKPMASSPSSPSPGRRVSPYPEGTPLSNLLLTLLNNLGVPTERFGDSTGELGELSELSNTSA